jgi:hypothetical protein
MPDVPKILAQPWLDYPATTINTPLTPEQYQALIDCSYNCEPAIPDMDWPTINALVFHTDAVERAERLNNMTDEQRDTLFTYIRYVRRVSAHRQQSLTALSIAYGVVPVLATLFAQCATFHDRPVLLRILGYPLSMSTGWSTSFKLQKQPVPYGTTSYR